LLCACLPRIFDLEHAHGGLLWGMLARRRGPARRSLGHLTSLEGGNERLIDGLERSLGPALCLEAPVARLAVDAGGGYRVEPESGPAYQAGAVVLACPVAEAAYEQLITLPMFAAMTARDVHDVVEAVTKVVAAFRSDR
jgi:protoporphyrinogen oxidase